MQLQQTKPALEYSRVNPELVIYKLQALIKIVEAQNGNEFSITLNS